MNILHPTHQTLSRHLDGALPTDRARRVEAHLARCAACARKVEILREAADLCRPPRKALDAVMNGLMDRLGQPDWQPDAPALAETLEVNGLVHVR
ncbi:MAG TPA: zf-HC2 domain-containing protein, partial [Candidatus Sumerlaeota bacterium]|nr:zf-HC2 domain-containing protein [Candidatus Sumerlaeota bacterium]